jgi:hypothetical protein
MKTLLKQTEVYKVDGEGEAIQMIQDYKDGQLREAYTLSKSGYVYKTKKSKGEIIDAWYVVTIEKSFNE